jgi:FAD/FMN-containing dehydrogenase
MNASLSPPLSSSPSLRRSPDPVLDRFANEIGPAGSVSIEGSRTRWLTGGELAAGTRVLSAPSGIVEHRVDEMTVRVRAGTSVAELSAALAERGQRCALPERGGSVGGAVAVGENHLEHLGRGALRASVLEVRYVSADGRLVVGGGPTVKNVTGFDLPRLLTGSLGTVGLIGEVILRTNPIPAYCRWVRSEDADPFQVLSHLARCGAVLWDGQTVWALIEGHPPEVAEQYARISRFAAYEDVMGPPDLPMHRWSVAPGEQRRILAAPTDRFVASIGSGTVFASTRQPTRPIDPGVRSVSQRIKAEFDPTGRLNPGRDPLNR